MIGGGRETLGHQFNSSSFEIRIIAAVAAVAGWHRASAAWPARSPRAARRDRRCDWRESAPAPHRDRRSARRSGRDAPRRRRETHRRAWRNSKLVDSAMTKPQLMTGRARQRRIERRPRRMPEARGDIAVGPQQIGGAGFGIVARGGQTLRHRQSRPRRRCGSTPTPSGASTAAPLPNSSSVNRVPALMKASVRNIGSPSARRQSAHPASRRRAAGRRATHRHRRSTAASRRSKAPTAARH